MKTTLFTIFFALSTVVHCATWHDGQQTFQGEIITVTNAHAVFILPTGATRSVPGNRLRPAERRQITAQLKTHQIMLNAHLQQRTVKEKGLNPDILQESLHRASEFRAFAGPAFPDPNRAPLNIQLEISAYTNGIMRNSEMSDFESAVCTNAGISPDSTPAAMRYAAEKAAQDKRIHNYTGTSSTIGHK